MSPDVHRYKPTDVLWFELYTFDNVCLSNGTRNVIRRCMNESLSCMTKLYVFIMFYHSMTMIYWCIPNFTPFVFVLN